MAVINSSITLLPLPETDNEKVYVVVITIHQNIRIWNIPVDLDHTIYTTVTKHPDVITRWIGGVYADFGGDFRRFVGMEVEIDFITARARTLQFCIGNRCLVIQLEEHNQPNCPPSLVGFMQDQTQFAFVVCQAVLKIRPLEMALGILQDRGMTSMILDLCNYMEPTFSKWGLLRLFRPGGDHQGVVHLDWGGPNAYQLSPAQVHYACINALLNIHIAERIWNLN